MMGCSGRNSGFLLDSAQLARAIKKSLEYDILPTRNTYFYKHTPRSTVDDSANVKRWSLFITFRKNSQNLLHRGTPVFFKPSPVCFWPSNCNVSVWNEHFRFLSLMELRSVGRWSKVLWHLCSCFTPINLNLFVVNNLRSNFQKRISFFKVKMAE